MKKLLFITVFVLSLTNSLFAQSGWYAVSNTPLTSDVRSLQFVNPNTGYAACYAGVVAKTTNSGINWIIINAAPDTVNFESLQFLNVSTGYIFGHGQLYKTTTAGINWNQIITGVWEPQQKNGSVYFLNNNTGFISGGYGITKFLKKTTNGGNTWEDKTATVGANNSRPLGQILFVNANTGFILKGGYIFKTINVGESWDSLITAGLDYEFKSIQFINEVTGYVVGENGRFFKTTNSGNNWREISFPLLPPPFNYAVALKSVYFVSELTGFVCGNVGYVAKTTNGGLLWSVQNIANTGPLASIIMTSPTTGCSVGGSGSILTTTNGGINWNRQYKGFPEVGFRGVYSIDSNTTFAVTDNIYSSGSRIYSTTNGGADWIYKNSGYSISLNDVAFTSADTGFIIGDSNKVLKTTNRGVNWVLKTPEIIENKLFSIFFVNSNTGYIAGRLGSFSGGSVAPFVLRTLDAGESWTRLQIPGVLSYQSKGDLYFLNVETGFVCGEGGNIYKTTDRGANWTTINTGSTGYLHSIYFTSVSTGYVSGYQKVSKTTNGGLNWIDLPLPENIKSQLAYINKIRFINPNIGYFVGNDVGIIKTIDAGNTWFRETLIAPALLHSLSFLNGNIGYAVGEGIILKTSPLTGVQTFNNIISNDYLLYQNYPNPFNPVTKIKYNLPKAGFVTLKIFNVLGKEVAWLVNKFNQAGSYEINWNASQYPSGIYFYKIETSGFSQIRKMILLK